MINRPVAMITGASSGIGEATAKTLLAKDYAVVLIARNEQKLEQVKAEIDPRGDQTIMVVADVVRRDDMKKAAQAALESFGRIDVLFNNAGIMPLTFMKNLMEDDWDRTIDVNIKGVLNGIGAVLPTMMTQKSGHILSTSSVAGAKVFPTSAVYSASKFAIEALMEGLRQEVTNAYNIRVTILRPGAIATNLGETVTDPEAGAFLRSMATMVEPLHPQDIANAVAYVVTQPDKVSINEIAVRPTTQEA